MFTIRGTFVCAPILVLMFTLFGSAQPMADTSDLINPDDENADGGDSVSNYSYQSNLAAGKTVTFYTSYAYQVGHHWHMPFKLWVSEPPDRARRLLGRSARSTIRDKAGIAELSEVQKERYKSRVEAFIADSESREEVVIVFDADADNRHYVLADEQGNTKTDRNGNLQGVLVLPELRAKTLLQRQNLPNGWLRYRAVSEDHVGSGLVQLIPPIGTSIVSDIDDTIKDTGITKGHAVVLRNTFFATFKQVPCMANLFSSFGGDITFHYVSGAPWQLYSPLVDFMFEQDDGYPWGSLHMKDVRTNLSEKKSYLDIWKLVKLGSKQVTYEQKIEQITQLIMHFPARKFVLVGDSGERDPEVFTDIRKRFPAQIERVFIRDLDGISTQNNKRFVDMDIIAGDASPVTGCPKYDSLIQ